MPRLVEMPGGGLAEFPDTMSEQEIAAAIRSSQPVPPTLGERVQARIEVAAPVVGATAGAVLGGGVGLAGGPAAPATVPTGVIAGSILGGMTGTAFAQATRSFLTGQQQSLLQQFIELAKSGAITMTGEAVMRGAGLLIPPVLGAARRFFVGRATPEAVTARRLLQPHGAEVSLAQQAGEVGTPAAILEGIASKAFLGAGTMTRFFRRQEVAAADVADTVFRQMGTDLTDSQIAKVFVEMMKGEARLGGQPGMLDLHRATARALYDRARELTKGAEVAFHDVADFFVKQGHRADVRRLRQIAFPEGTQLITPAEGQQMIPLEMAREASSRLAEVARRTAKSTNPEDIPLANLAKFLTRKAKEAIETRAVGLTPEGAQAYQAADKFLKEGKQQFENRLITRFLRKMEETPGQLSTALFQGNDMSLDLLKRVKAVDADFFETAVRPRAAAKVEWDAARASQGTTGVAAGDPATITSGSLHSALKGFGEETIDVIFTPRHRVAFEQLTTTLDVVSRRGPANLPGPVAIQLAQTGAAVTLLALPFTGAIGGGAGVAGATALVFGPALLARIFSSEPMIRLLSDGLRAGVGSRTFARMMTQFSAVSTELLSRQPAPPSTTATEAP